MVHPVDGSVLDKEGQGSGEPAGKVDLTFDKFRDYLRLLARMQLPNILQGKMDASDVVQQTLLKAYQAADQFRGKTVPEQAGWLRQILANTLANAVRDFSRARRDVALERSLQTALDESSSRLEAWLAADQPSPSTIVSRNEQFLELAEGLTGLPDDQREALILRYCHGKSLVEIGESLGRTRAAVASLLRRGLQQLRKVLHPGQQPQ